MSCCLFAIDSCTRNRPHINGRKVDDEGYTLELSKWNQWSSIAVVVLQMICNYTRIFVRNLNLMKSRNLICPSLIAQLTNHFEIFAQSTAVSLPCSVQDFKTTGPLKRLLWTDVFSRDLRLRCVSDEYPILHKAPGLHAFRNRNNESVLVQPLHLCKYPCWEAPLSVPSIHLHKYTAIKWSYYERTMNWLVKKQSGERK